MRCLSKTLHVDVRPVVFMYFGRYNVYCCIATAECYFLKEDVDSGWLNRTQTMPTVKETAHRPSKHAKEHALPMLGVTGSTGWLVPDQVHNVGWLGLGQVNNAEREASLIMSSTGLVKASYCILNFLSFIWELRGWYIFSIITLRHSNTRVY